MRALASARFMDVSCVASVALQVGSGAVEQLNTKHAEPLILPPRGFMHCQCVEQVVKHPALP